MPYSEFSGKINDAAHQEAAAATDLIPESNAPSWRTFLAAHPAADRIPEASEDEKRDLAADLARQGQRQPVILVRVATRPNAPPQLLDGRTRLDLLSAAGVDVVDANGKMLIAHRVVQVADDAEAECLSLSLNVHRRHLTAEQKRDLIVQQLKATPEKSNRQIAKMVKASHHKVGAVRAKLESTGQVAQLTKTVGEDGKARKQPRSKPRKLTTKPQGTASKPSATPDDKSKHRNDIGPASTNELARKDAEIAELQNAKRRLEIENTGLRSEVAELRAANAGLRESLDDASKKFLKLSADFDELRRRIGQPAPPVGDGLDIPDYLDRTKWKTT